jgi:hypothetical protein
MNAQLLTLAVTASLMFTTAQGLPASDLSFAFTSLNSATRTPAVATGPQVSEPTNPRLLLGAFLTDVNGQLQVSRTVAGSTASRVLNGGDILRAITIAGEPTQHLHTRNQLDHATRKLGPKRQAVLEIDRPGTGTQQVQVTFHTADELARFAADSKAGKSLASR